MALKQIINPFIKALSFSLLTMSPAFAEDVTIIGTLKHTLKSVDTSASATNGITNDQSTTKNIQLLHIQLSKEAKSLLADRAKNATTHTKQFSLTTQTAETLAFPSQVQLDMNKVPVLDQGVHGTCVTFAVTGALDAAIGKGDYISQVCNLQLGSYLEKHGYGLSGWDGSFAVNVINQIEQFGIVNKEKQKTVGCGGLTDYPTYSAHNPESFIEPEQYRSMSELIFGNTVNWLDVFQRNDPVKTLNEVKQAINSGNRLVFAVMLPRTDLGIAGAVGKHKTWFAKDSWVLTDEVLKGLDSIDSAHEMIITGYDDEAVAVDDKGAKHQGLLKLRNSWGRSVGNYGEFYMSYDYFKLLAFDVTRISPN